MATEGMGREGSSGDGRTGGSDDLSSRARGYALALLFAGYTINYIDRQVITILQEPIKAELGLADWQLGLMTGLAFALFYAVMGIPIARLADRHSRKFIIWVSMIFWSAMTALCAAAQNFVSLLAFRIGLGVGEAGLTPSAHSLISDYYPPERRGSALAIYSSAGTIGMMVGFLAGGWIGEFFGWRMAMLAVAIPGVFLAVVIWLTMKEPRRGRYDAQSADLLLPHDEGMIGGLVALCRNRAFRYLALGCACHAFILYGQGNWAPPFLMRVHDMSIGEAGTWLALLVGGPGLIGMISVGYFSDWLAKRRPNGRMETVIGSFLLFIPVSVGAFAIEDTMLALIVLAGTNFFGGAYLAPAIASSHAMVRFDQRATASAVVMLGINLIGLGLGPLVAGVLSEYWLAQGAGDLSLRYALLALVPMEIVAIAFVWRAMRHENLARAAVSVAAV